MAFVGLAILGVTGPVLAAGSGREPLAIVLLCLLAAVIVPLVLLAMRTSSELSDDMRERVAVVERPPTHWMQKLENSGRDLGGDKRASIVASIASGLSSAPVTGA